MATPVITASVGAGGKNLWSDVKTVQSLLNRCIHLLTPYRPIGEDGGYGQKTGDVLVAFQRRVVGMAAPSGKVDPGSATWQALLKNARSLRAAHVEAFILVNLPAARKVKADWQIPVSITLAQAALESGWGRNVKGNAYFGIKGKAPDGSSTSFGTTEFVNGERVSNTQTFRAYENFAEAADDYGAFLNSNRQFAPCFTVKDDPLAFADKLQQGGYATAPNYAKELKSIIISNDLLQYDK